MARPAFGMFDIPVSLETLIQDSEVIVFAQVRQESGIPAYFLNPKMAGSPAKLEIREVFKGSVTEKSLLVDYEAGMTCPQPPRYFLGELVVAFLNPQSDGRYRTVGLSLGDPEFDLLRLLKAKPEKPVSAFLIDYLNAA